MCKDTQNNLKFDEKMDVFSLRLAFSAIKAINDVKGLG